MRIESTRSIQQRQVLHLPTDRLSRTGKPTKALTNMMLLKTHSWEVAELFSSELLVDAAVFEKLMHVHGKHPLGVGGHLWQKDGGTPAKQNNGKMYGVGVLFKRGGWLAANGEILLSEEYRKDYLTALKASGESLPDWAEKLL
jgi:hypothetical protein